jgi:hypothetical protein
MIGFFCLFFSFSGGASVGKADSHFSGRANQARAALAEGPPAGDLVNRGWR